MRNPKREGFKELLKEKEAAENKAENLISAYEIIVDAIKYLGDKEYENFDFLITLATRHLSKIKKDSKLICISKDEFENFSKLNKEVTPKHKLEILKLLDKVKSVSLISQKKIISNFLELNSKFIKIPADELTSPCSKNTPCIARTKVNHFYGNIKRKGIKDGFYYLTNRESNLIELINSVI